MDLTIEDEGLGVDRLRRIPHKSGKRNRLEAESNSSRQRWGILGVVPGILPIEGNSTRIYRAKDVGAKRTGRKDEPDLMERVRIMLAHAKLPKTFWAEALSQRLM